MRRRKTHVIVEVDRLALEEHCVALITKAATKFHTTAHEIRNPVGHKKPPEARAREWVVPELLATVFYKDVMTRNPGEASTWARHVRVSELKYRDEEPGQGWHRISQPMLADLLHYRDHTAVTLLLKRLREPVDTETPDV